MQLFGGSEEFQLSYNSADNPIASPVAVPTYVISGLQWL